MAVQKQKTKLAWFVYILVCSDQSYYTGSTNDLAKRVGVHNSGKGSKYTRARLPVKLIYQENVASKSEALKREAQIKKFCRFQKEKLVRN